MILFKNKYLKKMSLFYSSSWNGGIYLTPTVTGSKSSDAQIGAWIAMMRLGLSGYI